MLPYMFEEGELSCKVVLLMAHHRMAGTRLKYVVVKGKRYYLVPAGFMRKVMSATPYKLE
jgi:hypothetical protein